MKAGNYILLMAMVLMAVQAEAQVRATSISVNVSATVVSDSPVELTTLNNMVVTGEMDENNEIYISPITNTNAGLMRAKGRPNSQARMTYIIYEVLNEADGDGIISLRYEMSGNIERVQRASQLIDSGEAILEFGPDGLYYLWVGGRVDISQAAPGRYGGQFTLEIEYI
jgi:hypothetical protein